MTQKLCAAGMCHAILRNHLNCSNSIFPFFLNVQVQVLFEETFFNSNNQSFPVLCIDQPLEGGIGTVINLACYMYNIYCQAVANTLIFVTKLKLHHYLFICHTPNDFDSADPSSMQDAFHI